MTTKQLEKWKSEFGDDWAQRNPNSQESIQKRIGMWKEITRKVPDFSSLDHILEIGASIGINLIALQDFTQATLHATEPNQSAFDQLITLPMLDPSNASQKDIFEMPYADASMDLVFTSGVLIHIQPDHLLKATTEMMRISKKYILCIEYFSNDPETVNYRGTENFLFKRDFGAFFLDNFPSLKIVDYGFLWMPATGLGNMTWFLLKKE